METRQQKSKLGKTTGSLINYLMGNNTTLPEVGKGATVLSWSDRYAYEVMSVSKDLKTIIIQEYLPERIDKNGMSECQDYKYEKLNGRDETIVWRNNKWKTVNNVIEFEDSYYLDYETALREAKTTEEKDNVRETWIKPLYNENSFLKLVEGKTKAKKKYDPINIIFGVKQKYYDFSF